MFKFILRNYRLSEITLESEFINIIYVSLRLIVIMIVIGIKLIYLDEIDLNK